MDEILVEKIIEKEGATDGRAWTRYGVKDGNGEWYSTFEQSVVAGLKEGEKARIQNESKQVNGRIVKNLLAAEQISEEPKLGDGSWVAAKENPDKQRAITAAVALQQAVASVTHMLTTDSSKTDVTEKVFPVAAEYYRWLLQRAGLEQDSDIPF